MRIGIDCRNYGPSYGYMGEYVQNLVSYLEKLEDGHKYVLFFDEKGLHEYEPSSSSMQCILTKSVPFSLWEQVRFPVELSKAKIDTMLFFHASIPLFFFKSSLLSIADLADFFYPNKELKSWWGRYSHGFLLRQSVRRAGKVIIQSNLTKHDIIEVFNIPEEHTVVIPPMDILTHETTLSETEGNTYLMNENISPSFLLFAGDIREHKNIPRLLEAYALLSGEKIPDLVLAGREDPNYHEVRSTVIRLGLQSRVHICNPNARELEYLSSHTIAQICPSLYEGSVQDLLLAMRSKLPIVASVLPIREDILSKDEALFFRAMSREDMKEALQTIITDSGLRTRLSGKNHDMTSFSVSSVCSKIGALFALPQGKISSKKDDNKEGNAII